MVRPRVRQLPEVHQRVGRLGLRGVLVGDVLVRLSAVAGVHRPSDPGGHRQAELPTPGAAGMLPEGILHADAEVLEPRSAQAAEVLRNLSDPAGHEAGTAEDRHAVRRASEGSPGVPSRRHHHRAGQVVAVLARRAELRQDRPLQSRQHRRAPRKSSLVVQPAGRLHPQHSGAQQQAEAQHRHDLVAAERPEAHRARRHRRRVLRQRRLPLQPANVQ